MFGVPVAAFLSWDTIAFRPHLADIDRILAQADPEDRQLTPTMHRLLDASVSNMPGQVSRMLLARLDAEPGNRHATEALWALSLKLHFHPDERDALFATLAWNGTDHGLDRHARRIYGRPLSGLTGREAATVVAWTHAPGMYLRAPERLQARADYLIRTSGVR